MKVSELTGEELDYWTAKAQGWKKGYRLGSKDSVFSDRFPKVPTWQTDKTFEFDRAKYTPTTNWQQAGELIGKFRLEIGLAWEDSDGPVYFCRHARFSSDSEIGPTPQIAICRAVVASVYGDEVKE